jgi:hypothetical protein
MLIDRPIAVRPSATQAGFRLVDAPLVADCVAMWSCGILKEREKTLHAAVIVLRSTTRPRSANHATISASPKRWRTAHRTAKAMTSSEKL